MLLIFGAGYRHRERCEGVAASQAPDNSSRAVVGIGLPLAAVLAITLWVVFGLFGVRPDPPSATSEIYADAQPQNWAQGGRTGENSGFTPVSPPVPQQIRWTYSSDGPLLTAPAVVDGRVYLTTQDGRTLALDHENGRQLWEFRSGQFSNSTPAVAGDMVVAAFRKGLIVALDRETGTPRWERDIKSPILASPVVANGIVYLGAGDSNLHALDAATGEHLWSFDTGDWVVSSVAYLEDTVVVASQGKFVYILDGKTGRKRLKYDTGFIRSGTGPVIDGNLVLFTSSDGRIWAIDREAETYPLERFFWMVKINLYVWKVISQPPAQRGTVWNRRIGGDLSVTSAVGHGSVFAVSKQGVVYARATSNGAKQWTKDMGVGISASPTVAGDTVLIATLDGVVHGLDAATGEALWDFPVGGKITDSPIVAGDTIYVVSEDGKLLAITGG